MDAATWIRAFRELHEKAKKGGLSSDEAAAYVDSKEQLARSLLAAQGLAMRQDESARRSFRVALMLQVELRMSERTVKTMTVDLSAGGFSAVVDPPPPLNVRLEFTLKRSSTEVLLTGKAKVVGAREIGRGARVSFAFDALAPKEQEKLEMTLFDAALARMPS